VGQPGHANAFDELLRRVGAVAGENVWVHEVPFVVPQVLEATLTLEAGTMAGKHRVYPFWPTGPRLNTTPVEGIDGRLVYVGRAALDEFPARSLGGQIAVIEMTNGENWRNALAFGARAVLFLGSEGETHWDMRSHEMVVPLSIPCFYIPQGELAMSLRNRETAYGHIYSKGIWRETNGRNIYALVPSRHPELSRKAMVIVVQSDSMCMIPELAAGADAAVDTALALTLMRRFAEDPPEHPVLFTFLDGFSLNMKGIRYMLGALAVPPDARRDEAAEFEALLDTYSEYAQTAEGLRLDPEAVFKVHQPVYRDLHAFIKDEASQEVLAVENLLSPLRLEGYTLPDGTPEKQRVAQQIAQLDLRRIAYNVARKQMLEGPGELFAKRVFSWTGMAGKSAVTDDGLMRIEDHAIDNARVLWQQAQRRIIGQVADVERILDEYRIRDKIQGEIRRALNLGSETDIPLSFLVGIDLSDAGIVVGPQSHDRMLHTDYVFSFAQFIEWFLKADWAGIGGSLPPGALRSLGHQAWTSGDSTNSFVIGEVVMVTSQATSYGLPHMSWATLDAYRGKVDTPQDRVDRLNWQRLSPQIHLTAEIVKRMANDAGFVPESSTGAKWRMVTGQVVAQAPGEPMARLPQRGYLGSLINGYAAGGGVQSGRYSPNWALYGRVGMRRQEFAFTGWDGHFNIRDLPTIMWEEIAKSSMQAHQLAEDGSIVATIDLNSVRKENSFNTYLGRASSRVLTGTVFPCTEMNAFHLYDPRFITEMPGITIVDARTGNIPKRLNFGLHNGIISGLMEARVRWQIIQRIGITANRLMLLNVQDGIHDPSIKIRESSTGFAMNQPPFRHPVHQAAHDMYLLDERRLSDYRRAGIKSEAIEEMRDRSQGLLAAVDDAIEADDGGRMFHAAAGALSNEVRAYRAVRDLGNDVVRAVVFLLLGLIPFSFALQRMVFATPHPYRQIGYTGVIFALMALLLWSFHPAFRITSQPLVIIMAFAIILMSAMVVSVIFYKFKSNVEELKSEYAESSGAQTSRLGLIATATKLGLANMRKRILRTGLTGATIVIITFAMLCFTSTTTYIGEKDLTLEIEKPASYTGVLLRQPSQRRIRRRAEHYLHNIITNMDLGQTVGSGSNGPPALNPTEDVTSRYWWVQSPYFRTWRIHVKSPVNGRQVSLTSGLGLQGNEDRFTQVDRVLPNWERFAELERTFESTQRGGCYVADEVADTLGVGPGATLLIGGRDMELVGTYDPKALEELSDLDGRNLMVLDYAAMPDTQKWMVVAGDWDVTLLATELQSGEGLTQEDYQPYVPASQTVVLPASFLRNYGLSADSHLRTMAIRTDSIDVARAVAVETGQRMAFPAYYGSPGEGSRVLVFVPFFPKAPRSLWILMVLAGLIIFNTMMSSIAERKNEIYIYTSMGLAPLHIGVLFLAEAVTYGLMGSIFGYVVGQGLATFLGRLGWLGGMSLNYSGTHAIATMAMVVCITVVSSIIPAYRAGRLAVPSNRMRWSVPTPVNGRILDKLPFTVTDKTANGTVLYLHDYFGAHRDGAIGCFITDELSLIPMGIGDSDGPDGVLRVMKLRATVSLAPYDLGVRQAVEIAVVSTDSPEIFELDISLEHDGGQVNSWIRLNKTFLGDLRRQLLGWRNLRARRIVRYIAEARERLSLIAADA